MRIEKNDERWMEDRAKASDALRAYRYVHGWTQPQAAKKTGVSVSTYKAAELHGGVNEDSWSEILGALGKDAESLFEWFDRFCELREHPIDD